MEVLQLHASSVHLSFKGGGDFAHDICLEKEEQFSVCFCVLTVCSEGKV